MWYNISYINKVFVEKGLRYLDRKLEEIFEKLYFDNYKNLLKNAYRLTYEKNAAEEIVQDAFIEAYKKIERLQNHENLVGWLYITVKNISKAYLRKNKEIKKLFPLEDYNIAVTDNESEEAVLSNYLTKKDTDIMLKFYKDKKSLMEISNEYGISLSACKMRLKRARDKFKYKYENDK